MTDAMLLGESWSKNQCGPHASMAKGGLPQSRPRLAPSLIVASLAAIISQPCPLVVFTLFVVIAGLLQPHWLLSRRHLLVIGTTTAT